MHYNMEATPAFWIAVAKRSGDTAPAREDLRSWVERSDGASRNGRILSNGLLCNACESGYGVAAARAKRLECAQLALIFTRKCLRRTSTRGSRLLISRGKLRPRAAFAAWAVPREAYGVRAACCRF